MIKVRFALSRLRDVFVDLFHHLFMVRMMAMVVVMFMAMTRSTMMRINILKQAMKPHSCQACAPPREVPHRLEIQP